MSNNEIALKSRCIFQLIIPLLGVTKYEYFIAYLPAISKMVGARSVVMTTFAG